MFAWPTITQSNTPLYSDASKRAPNKGNPKRRGSWGTVYVHSGRQTTPFRHSSAPIGISRSMLFCLVVYFINIFFIYRHCTFFVSFKIFSVFYASLLSLAPLSLHSSSLSSLLSLSFSVSLSLFLLFHSLHSSLSLPLHLLSLSIYLSPSIYLYINISS